MSESPLCVCGHPADEHAYNDDDLDAPILGECLRVLETGTDGTRYCDCGEFLPAEPRSGAADDEPPPERRHE